MLLAFIATLTGIGCAAGDTAATAAEARAKAQETWNMVIEGADPLALERMDIYLVEDDTDPEMFKLYGDEATLVGVLRPEQHVGYEEDFDQLIGKPVTLDAAGGDPRESEDAYVTIQGRRVPVLGGTLRVDKVTGSWSGSEGDKTLWGTVELRVEDGENERTIRGTFAVHAVGWG
jgi:hypothetical protein